MSNCSARCTLVRPKRNQYDEEQRHGPIVLGSMRVHSMVPVGAARVTGTPVTLVPCDQGF